MYTLLPIQTYKFNNKLRIVSIELNINANNNTETILSLNKFNMRLMHDYFFYSCWHVNCV